MSIRRIVRRCLTVAVASHALVACMPEGGSTPSDPDAGPAPAPQPSSLTADVAVFGLPGVAGPDAPLTLTAHARIGIDGCNGCEAQVAVALGDAVACVYDGEAGAAQVEFELPAPSSPGRHALRYAAVLDQSCSAAERLARSGTVLGHLQVEAATPPPPPDENQRPRVMGVDVFPADFSTGCETRVRADAMDPDGDPVTLHWQLDGRDAGRGPELVIPGGPARRVSVQVTARDNRARAHTESVQVELPACDLPAGALVSADGRSAFLKLDGPMTYAEARDQAFALGGHLATVDSEAQMQALTDAFRGGWVGFWSPDRDGAFRWITGESGGYGAFCPGEPNNAGGGEYAVELWDIGCFNDESPARTRPAIVELELGGGADDVSAGGAFERRPVAAGQTARHMLRLERAQAVRVRVADADGGCEGVGDPTLAALAAGEVLAANDDANGSVCPELVFEAPAGPVDLVVQGFSGRALPEHTLHVELDAEPPAPVLPELRLVDGDGQCPGGWAPAPVAVAEAFPREVCSLLGSWYIVRLAGGAAFDGPGYGCNLRPAEPNPLGQTLCARR